MKPKDISIHNFIAHRMLIALLVNEPILSKFDVEIILSHERVVPIFDSNIRLNTQNNLLLVTLDRSIKIFNTQSQTCNSCSILKIEKYLFFFLFRIVVPSPHIFSMFFNVSLFVVLICFICFAWVLIICLFLLFLCMPSLIQALW